MFRRIQELEGALLQVGSTPESSGQASDHPEELATPVRPSIDTSHASNVASGREELTFAGSSLSPITFAQTPASSLSQFAKESPAQIHRSARQWGPNWYFNGKPISSEAGRKWVSQRTDQPVSWADFSIPIVQIREASTLERPLSPALYELPDKEATREIMTMFFKSSFRLAFPVLDGVLFQTTLETAYEHVEGIPHSTMQLSAKACILSMLAIAPRIDMSRQLSFPIDADLCANKARSLLSSLAEDISLTTLQTAIMLVSSCLIVAIQELEADIPIANTAYILHRLARRRLFPIDRMSHSLRFERAYLAAIKFSWTREYALRSGSKPHPTALLAMLHARQRYLAFHRQSPSA